MASTFGLRAIPWVFTDAPYLKLWTWRTPHFEARVTADFNSYAWEILDLMATTDPTGVLLTEGRTGDFATAENEVRETIAKSYPTRLGYQTYAGPLATTFTLATGQRVDLGVFTGVRCIVTVKFPDASLHTYYGDVRIVNYDLRLTQESGQTLAIQPTHITSIIAEAGPTSINSQSSYTGLGRIYRGRMMAGCTGKPGYLPDTIDHVGPICGIHEDASKATINS